MKSVSVRDTTFCFKTDITHSAEKTRYPHYLTFDAIMELLKKDGFSVGADPEILKFYPVLSPDRRYGRKDALEFKAERYPAGFKITFYQNLNYENPNGGYYDFDKRQKMPYLMQKQFENVILKLKSVLLNASCKDDTKPDYVLAEDKLKRIMVEEWYYPQTDMSFDLSEIEGVVLPETPEYNILDRDGKPILNGNIKYFRDYSGYLCRGKCYKGLNNMWWVITDKYTLRNIANFQLFDLSPNDERSRVVPHKPPQEFLDRRKTLNSTSTKELLAELRLRGIRIKEN